MVKEDLSMYDKNIGPFGALKKKIKTLNQLGALIDDCSLWFVVIGFFSILFFMYIIHFNKMFFFVFLQFFYET
jgi:hypothetical protein